MTNLLHSEYSELAREMLMLLHHDDLASIVKTATCGRIAPVNAAEACTAVLLSCPDVAKLLSLRKLSSVFLLQYLTRREIVIRGHATRTQLVMAVLQHWEEAVKSKRNIKKEEPSMKEEPILYAMPDLKQEPSFEPECIIKEEPDFYRKKVIKEELSNEDEVSSTSASQVPVSSSAYFPEGNCDAASSVTSPAASASSIPGRVQVHSTNNNNTERIMSDEFALDFCVWFYMMVNMLQPCCADKKGDTLRPEIFCGNCCLEMYLVDGDRMEQCKASNNIECNKVMRELLSKLGLLFMPNTEGGIQVKKSSHGMIQVFCCGTIHCNDSFVGIFEQEFGLVTSPVDRTWKIAYSKINLKRLLKAYTPSLPRADVFAIEY
ncbi:hypothetical protein FHG87_011435 [Trinorchestia longiramus]|nr:hypothetical protein FHG87_011435 [Trinorchestia longiramus]